MLLILLVLQRGDSFLEAASQLQDIEGVRAEQLEVV